MNTHYYSAVQTAESNPGIVTYRVMDCGLPGDELSFETDSGVFSRNRVDFGTDLLIRSVGVLQGNVLDLGCGYGAVGASLAMKNPQARLWFADINERAVALCKKNLAKFIADGYITGDTLSRIFYSDGFSGILGNIADKFSVIVMNPPIRTGKANVFRLYSEAYEHISPGGSLYVVLQKKQGLGATRTELFRLFGDLSDIARKAGYHVLQARKMLNVNVKCKC